jgi:UDPglucose--hexose-1-phosphate uridylyltransferase
LKEGKRLVVEGERFVAFIPFFARYPYEIYLAPKKHLSSLAEFTKEDRKDLAIVLKALLGKYDQLFNFSFPYIMVIHQAPTDGKDYPDYHLHFEFYPPHRTAKKLKYLAGCEAGAGSFVNDTLPEEKAAELRAITPHNIEAILKLG